MHVRWSIPVVHRSRRMRSWKSQRQECQRSHIQTSVVGIPVGYIRLTSGKSDSQETTFIEIVSAGKHTLHHRCQRTTNLCISHSCRQFLIPCHQSQWLHSSHTIRNGTTEYREGSFRRDETFQNQAEFLRTFQRTVIIFP